MNIHDVNRGITKNKKPNRIGRGTGSGQGKTAGKGHKGQRSHAGWSQPAAFQGGMSPLVRRIPKRGFFNPFALNIGIVNLGEIDAAFEAGETVSPETIREKSVLKGRFDEIKILGTGELTKKLIFSVHRMSESAKEKIEKAGGTINVLAGKIAVEEKKAAARAKKGKK